jgi:hypothetical protein
VNEVMRLELGLGEKLDWFLFLGSNELDEEANDALVNVVVLTICGESQLIYIVYFSYSTRTMPSVR